MDLYGVEKKTASGGRCQAVTYSRGPMPTGVPVQWAVSHAVNSTATSQHGGSAIRRWQECLAVAMIGWARRALGRAGPADDRNDADGDVHSTAKSSVAGGRTRRINGTNGRPVSSPGPTARHDSRTPHATVAGRVVRRAIYESSQPPAGERLSAISTDRG
jgi:hypothetical protein